MTRLQVDIKDLYLPGAGISHDKVTTHVNDSDVMQKVVAIGKHLCGAATDLTLRCLFSAMDRTLCTPMERLFAEQCLQHKTAVETQERKYAGMCFNQSINQMIDVLITHQNAEQNVLNQMQVLITHHLFHPLLIQPPPHHM